MAANCLSDSDCYDACGRAKCGGGECYIPWNAEPCIYGSTDNIVRPIDGPGRNLKRDNRDYIVEQKTAGGCGKRCCNESCTDFCTGTTDCDCCKYMVEPTNRQDRDYANFIPAPNCWSSCPNPQAIYNTYGTPCPPTHPNKQAPNCPPPAPQYGPNNYPDLAGLTQIFVNNMNSGYQQFGCSFLYNRSGVLQAKLNSLVAAGTNPNWQQLLQNRIYYINLLVTQYCIMY